MYSASPSPSGTPLNRSVNRTRSMSSIGSPASPMSGPSFFPGKSFGSATSLRSMRSTMGGTMTMLENSPFQKAQPLVNVDVSKRRVVKRAVGGPGKSSLRTVFDGRLGFVAFERGVEWERPCVKAQIPKDTLPPLDEVIDMARKEFPLGAVQRRMRERAASEASTVSTPKRSLAFGGSEPYRGGPRLPVKRKPPRPTTAEQQREAANAEAALAEAAAAEAAAAEVAAAAAAEAEQTATEARPAERTAATVEVAEEAPEEEEDEPPPFPWSDDELRMVFSKFDLDKDGEIHKEELRPALHYIGCRPSKQVVADLANKQTSYATLGWEEFLEFLSKYREYELVQMRELFTASDKDCSGQLNLEEVHGVIVELGFNVTKQVVLEAMDALDRNNDGQMSLREFEGLREHLRQTEGLLKEEVEELKALYERAFDKPPCPELVAEQSWRISTYVGFSASREAVAKLCTQVDVDSTGTVSFPELLKIVRCIGDLEAENISEVLRSRGADPNHLKIEDLGIALSDLGYFVSSEAVFDVLDALGDTEEDDSLTFAELSAFLRIYRKVEGFTEAETKELKSVFDKEDVSGSGSLGTLEISRILRYFGFSRTVQEVQGLVEEVDFDGSGKLETIEYIKLMRRFHQAESLKRHRVFDREDVNKKAEVHRDRFKDMAARLQGGGVVDEELLAQAMAATIDALPPEATAGFTPGFFDRSGFEAFYKEYRKLALEQVRSNGGYTPKEVSQLKEVFERYDRDKSGNIEVKELHLLLIEYFPEATESKEGQQAIQQILNEIDGDGNYELEFSEFLWLMRKCDDQRDAADMRLEEQVVQECQLTQDEVDGYRQIFSANVDWTGEMKLDKIAGLLTKVIEFNAQKMEELAELVRGLHPQRKEVARFPHFLRIIKKLTEDNALGCNDAATRVVRQEEKAKRKFGAAAPKAAPTPSATAAPAAA